MRSAVENKLSELVTQVGASLRRDVLASSVVFPRTESLKDDEPMLELLQDSLDLDAAITYVQNHPEAVAISAREDLVLVLNILKELEEELVLNKFDQIQVYRGGLDLFRIVNKSAKSGRAAYVEINDYRRRIQGLLMQNAYSLWSRAGDIAVGGLLAFVLYTLYKSRNG